MLKSITLFLKSVVALYVLQVQNISYNVFRTMLIVHQAMFLIKYLEYILMRFTSAIHLHELRQIALHKQFERSKALTSLSRYFSRLAQCKPMET